MNSMLEKIKEFAELAHGDQERKFSPEPYIRHPVRVMEMCAEYTSDQQVLAAALLHDVLEDTMIRSDEMFSFLQSLMNKSEAQKTLSIVRELTDVYVKKDFPQWNRRKRKEKELERLKNISAESQTIKYADIIDNSQTISGAEPDFQKKYLQECRSLLKVLNSGNVTLHKLASDVVRDLLANLASGTTRRHAL